MNLTKHFNCWKHAYYCAQEMAMTACCRCPPYERKQFVIKTVLKTKTQRERSAGIFILLV